jgi:hypothetical protein
MALLALLEWTSESANDAIRTSKVNYGPGSGPRRGSKKPFGQFQRGTGLSTYGNYLNGGGGSFQFIKTSTNDIACGFWCRWRYRNSNQLSIGTNFGSGAFFVFNSAEDATNPWDWGGTAQNSFELSGYTGSYGSQFGCNYWWSNASSNKITPGATYTPDGQYDTVNLLDEEWHWVEFRFKADDSAGIFQLYVDGTQVYNITGADTILGTSPPTFTGFDHVHLITSSISPNAGRLHIADMVIYDSSTSPTGCLTTSSFPLGPCFIERLRADAAGSNSDWSKPSYFSSNYQLSQRTTKAGFINHGLLSSVADGDIDSYSYESLSGSPTIKAVAMEIAAKATGTGDAYIQAYCKSSSSTATSTSGLYPVSEGLEYHVREISQDPNAASAWTSTTLNAAEFGFKYSSS